MYKVRIASFIILLVPMVVMVETSLAQPGRGTQSVTVQLPKAPALEKAPVLEIKADQVKGKTSPILYGLMTEEINYSYDSGLYAELIRNCNFSANVLIMKGKIIVN